MPSAAERGDECSKLQRLQSNPKRLDSILPAGEAVTRSLLGRLLPSQLDGFPRLSAKCNSH